VHPNRQADDVQLLDAGHGRRLDRLGRHLVDRPVPAAMGPPAEPERWSGADLRFDTGLGWSGPGGPPEPWTVSVAGLGLELRATSAGGVGLYPEHAASLPWLEDQVRRRPEPRVLNLFAHTGLATLAAARAGASVTHVDSARSAVGWARRNAELSGLTHRPVRWIVDDALAFAVREARRGRRYDGIVLDPPSYGHAGRRTWRLSDDLPGLLAACAAVATRDVFVLLTAHSTGLAPDALVAALAGAFPERARHVNVRPLEQDAASGVRLRLGWAVRIE
jgi:23S rRNA (cytosine1962-C5)-methyltransferase